MACLRFGDCTFDPQAHVLTRAGREVSLSTKAFLLLEALVERRPQVLSHAQLRDRIWPRTFVSYSCLAGLVAEVRKVIGDDRRHPRYVRTVRGVGYGFIGQTATAATDESVVEPSPFSLRWKSHEFPLVSGANVIGRSPECQVRIPSTSISRQHSRIVVAGDRAVLEDLGSKNGTRVRGRRIAGPTLLADGEEILLGHEAVLLVAAPSTATTDTDKLSSKPTRG